MHMTSARTTLNLDAELLAQAQKATGIIEKTALINEGLLELVKRAALERLANLGGSIKNAKLPRRRKS